MNLRERRGGWRNVGERSESASQNSFSIATSQKVAAPRVSRGAEFKIFAREALAEIARGEEIALEEHKARNAARLAALRTRFGLDRATAT